MVEIVPREASFTLKQKYQSTTHNKRSIVTTEMKFKIECNKCRENDFKSTSEPSIDTGSLNVNSFQKEKRSNFPLLGDGYVLEKIPALEFRPEIRVDTNTVTPRLDRLLEKFLKIEQSDLSPGKLSNYSERPISRNSPRNFN